MPNSGTPDVYSSGSTDGAPSTCTDAGPPERMIAFGFMACISANDIVRGTISEYTCASRTRRAISWAYCAPKSTTSTACSGVDVTTDPNGGIRQRRGDNSVPHADALRALQAFALGEQCRGHHDLGLLEFLHRFIAAGRHRRAQRAEEIHASVVLVGRADEDLAHGTSRLRLHSSPAGQGGMERGHAPVVATTGRFDSRG